MRGARSKVGDPNYQHHTASILCVAASDTGKYVATGGADKRLIIWSADDLKPLRIFTQHRDAVTSLAFRRGTNQLYSCSADRTVKIWDELAYIETLFGHQDHVVDLASLALERCVSVGARDRTARLWKVVDQTQLIFRGGGTSEKRRPPPRHEQDEDAKGGRRTGSEVTGPRKSHQNQYYGEGSIDRVALVDEETFVTGSDNGSLCLWTLHKKKPVFTVPLAHGLDPPLKPEDVSADVTDATTMRGTTVAIPVRQPRWITALATVPYSDVVMSGSWDGKVRLWRVSGDKKRLEPMGWIGGKDGEDGGDDDDDEENEERNGNNNGNGRGEEKRKQNSLRGIINDLSILESSTLAHADPKAKNTKPDQKIKAKEKQTGLLVLAALGTEHRLGRWKKIPGDSGSNRPVVFQVPRRVAEKVDADATAAAGDAEEAVDLVEMEEKEGEGE